MRPLEITGQTDPGLVRTNNEDSFFFDPAVDGAIVADGMGGAACGEIASHITVDVVAGYLRQMDGVSRGAVLEEAIRKANELVRERARQETACRGMGSTIVAACWSLPTVHIANVGDSRAYLYHAGELRLLTHDQTLVNELRHQMGLTEAQVDRFPHKNVLTMAIGSTDNLVIHTSSFELDVGDQLLLCSDGLTGTVSDKTMAEMLDRQISLPAKVESLIAAARAAGAPDNVTAVLLRYNR